MIRIQALVAAVAATVAWASVVGAAPVPSEPIHTSKTRFRIPYRFDTAELQRIGAAEIRLYVSADRGLHWRHAKSVQPSAGRFDFTAPGEGEYWFAVRTLDRAGRLHPPQNQFQPGLKVVVDTTPPLLQVTLEEPQPGQVRLSWQADDRYLDPSRLRLQYRQGQSNVWQSVGVRPSARGQTSWSVSHGGVVAVRGSVPDRASNTARVERQIRVSPASAIPQPELPDFSEPIARRPAGGSSEVVFPQPAGVQAKVTSNQVEKGEYTLRSGDARPTIRPQVSERPAASSDPGRRAPQRDAAGAVPQVMSVSDEKERETAAYRVVDTKAFKINYKIEDVGPSGLGGVELFITQNDGAKWWKYGDDRDRQSPFEVRVPGDGVYGFAIRARSGVGLAADPPRPGEKPSIVVVVDRKPPVVQLQPPRQGEGPSLNKIRIQWRVVEDNPAEKPVSLAYSADPDGPWTPITGWQPDEGSYLWTVDGSVPPSLYIAVAARDAAGNVTRAVTSQPVVVDLSKPTARIVDVESQGEAGRQ